MRTRIRNGTSIVVVGLCLAIGIAGLSAPEVAFTGITLRMDGSALVVDSVDPASSAAGSVQPGMVVHDVDREVVANIPEKRMDMALRGDFLELGLVDPAGGWTEIMFPPQVAPATGFMFLVGTGLLLGTALWVGRGQAGEALRPMAIPLAVALAAQLLLAPNRAENALLVAAAVVLPTIALLLVADGFLDPVATRSRRIALAAALSAAAGYVAMVLGAFTLISGGFSDVAIAAALVLFAGVTVVPAIARLRYGRRAAPRLVPRSPDRLPIVLAAVTPTVFALGLGYASLGLSLSIPLIWLLLVVVVLQANARIDVFRVQRDTVVAATEVERARLAADLHDDALQEMTVLVRRLDDRGDSEASALARSIADRLREVCGDLRLPILDELGAGPALEWLVVRVGETSGRPIQLERDDRARPPADVELAVFRVAQEALANAVKHGAPPVVVRYASTVDRASLSITDQGGGIAADAAAVAGRTGHYGLLNMRQRAEQIGTTIDVRRPPGGGTTIGLDWSGA